LKGSLGTGATIRCSWWNIPARPALDLHDRLTISDLSPMPRDYGKQLSHQELEDLPAYLARQVLRAGNN
jgi:hypothetical protein